MTAPPMPEIVAAALTRTLMQDETGDCPGSRAEDIPGTIDVLRAEVRRMHDILTGAEIEDFLKAVAKEARHQRARGRDDQDAMKAPEDWLWTLAYLATKALQSRRYGERTKYLHHIITAAALCANWHRYAAADRFDK